MIAEEGIFPLDLNFQGIKRIAREEILPWELNFPWGFEGRTCGLHLNLMSPFQYTNNYSANHFILSTNISAKDDLHEFIIRRVIKV